MSHLGRKTFKDDLLSSVVAALRLRLFPGGPVDTLEMVRKVQGGNPTYKHELLALTGRNGTVVRGAREVACPPLLGMRAGLRHDRACVCRARKKKEKDVRCE